jgi:signal transduction histidine kinase
VEKVDPARAQASFAKLSDVVLQAASERSLVGTLRRLVAGARALTGARYAAVGVPEETGAAFRHFLHDGMPAEVIDALGPLPRTHGLLGAMLSDPHSYTTADITSDPRFEGWPRAHPPMRHFLGMPLVTGGVVVGAFYLTGEAHDAGFTDEDHELMAVLAAHAAVAVDNARLLEASRERAVTEERNRLARELHDAVAQSLFSLRLTAQAAARRLPDDPQGATDDLAEVGELAAVALAELRTAISALRPSELDRDGLAAAVSAHAEMVGRSHRLVVALEVEPDEHDPRWRELDRETGAALLRIVQEALHNAAVHADAGRVAVTLEATDQRVWVSVTDDGRGFDIDAAATGGGLGLASMRERAHRVDGRLVIESTPSAGTTVSIAVEGGL